MHEQKIISYLTNPSVPNIRKAASLCRKKDIWGYEETLLCHLYKLLGNPKYWETQTELIFMLGKHKYQPLLPVVLEIVTANKEHDMITYAATCAYIMLIEKQDNIWKIICDLLQEGKSSVIAGVSDTIYAYCMIPTEEWQSKIINICASMKIDEDSIYGTDKLFGIISMCPLWSAPNIKSFLENFNSYSEIALDQRQLSLKGEYISKPNKSRWF